MIKHVELKRNNGEVIRGYLTDHEKSKLIVIMFHGFTGNKTEHAGHFRNFSRVLLKNKISSIRFDFYGNGESDGEFKDFTFDTLIDDSEQIIQYAKTNFSNKSIVLLGYSMGGAVTAMMAVKHPEIENIILWSPAGNILNIIKKYYEDYPKNEDGNIIMNSSFELSKEMYESVSKYDTYNGFDEYLGNVLIIQGEKDLAVKPEVSKKFYELTKNSKYIMIPCAGHGYDKIQERDILYRESLKFLEER